MVTIEYTYLDASGNTIAWSTDPMPVEAAMDRIMRFAQAGLDVVRHNDTGRMDVLLAHRVTGITIVPVVAGN